MKKHRYVPEFLFTAIGVMFSGILIGITGDFIAGEPVFEWVLGDTWLNTFFQYFPGETNLTPKAMRLIFAVVLFMVTLFILTFVIWMRANHFRRKNKKTSDKKTIQRSYFEFSFLTFSIMLTSLLISLSSDLISGQSNLEWIFWEGLYEDQFYRYVAIGLSLFFTLSFVWFMINQHKKILPIQSLIDKGAMKSQKAVMAPISIPRDWELIPPEHDKGTWQLRHSPSNHLIDLQGNIDKDLEAIHCIYKKVDTCCKFSWEILLHILGRHLKPRENDEPPRIKVFALLSTEGTTKYAEMICQWLKIYAEHVDFYEASHPLDFTHIDLSYQAMSDNLKELTSKPDIKEHDVVIDITNGNSLMSAACTLATLHNDTHLEYVNTNDPDEIINYTLEIQAAPQ